MKVVKNENIDLTQYVGKKVKIEKVELCNNNNGHYLKLTTETVDVLGDEKPILLTATKLLGVKDYVDNEIIISENSKAHKFFKTMGVTNEADLEGKEVVVQLTEPNDTGKRFLTF